jgi:effector-binding domain-containing protein
VLPPLIPELFDWLDLKKMKPAGAPFFRYLNMEGVTMHVEVGIPVPSHITGDNRVRPGSFPEGEYVKVIYTGPYSNLPQVHSELEKWKDKNNIRVKGGGAEFYPTDPASEPNPEKWQTIIISQIDEG